MQAPSDRSIGRWSAALCAGGGSVQLSAAKPTPRHFAAHCLCVAARALAARPLPLAANPKPPHPVERKRDQTTVSSLIESHFHRRAGAAALCWRQ